LQRRKDLGDECFKRKGKKKKKNVQKRVVLAQKRRKKKKRWARKSRKGEKKKGLTAKEEKGGAFCSSLEKEGKKRSSLDTSTSSGCAREGKNKAPRRGRTIAPRRKEGRKTGTMYRVKKTLAGLGKKKGRNLQREVWYRPQGKEDQERKPLLRFPGGRGGGRKKCGKWTHSGDQE